MSPGNPQKSFSWTQFFPPTPTFTESHTDMPSDLRGKVYIVTGANSGMGRELTRVLEAITDVRKAAPKSKGKLVFLSLDLVDLTKIKVAAREFLAQESKLHVLFNNAGVMVGPAEPPLKTAQGYELALGVNCVGTFLFTQLLTPTLMKTAKSEPANTIRVIWLSSFGLEHFAPLGRGVDLDNIDYHNPKPNVERYGISKAGDWLLGVEYARRHCDDGVVSVALNPGNVRTELARDQSAILKLVAGAIVYPIINGVYTQLFAAFSPECGIGKADWTSQWVVPWGRLHPLRRDLTKATLPVDEGGNGNAQQFWEWNEKQVQQYLD